MCFSWSIKTCNFMCQNIKVEQEINLINLKYCKTWILWPSLGILWPAVKNEFLSVIVCNLLI